MCNMLCVCMCVLYVVCAWYVCVYGVCGVSCVLFVEHVCVVYSVYGICGMHVWCSCVVCMCYVVDVCVWYVAYVCMCMYYILYACYTYVYGGMHVCMIYVVCASVMYL